MYVILIENIALAVHFLIQSPPHSTLLFNEATADSVVHHADQHVQLNTLVSDREDTVEHCLSCT